MSNKNQNNEWLTFSKSAKRGLGVVVVIIATAILLPRMLAHYQQPEYISIREVPEKVKKVIQEQEEISKVQTNSKYKKKAKFKVPNQKFNPNDYEKQDWMKLGLSDKQAASIVKYTSKGGNFYKTEDVKKLYVVSDELYELIKDSIEIPNQSNNQSYKNEEDSNPFVAEALNIELNDATKEELIKLYGIGDYFGSKIVEYRESLGGYHAKSQLLEIYNFKPETLEDISDKISVDKTKVIKLNVNTASAEELKSHPYISWKVANSIVNYRNQHGSYKQLSDLLQSALINQELLDKLVPYLVI